MRGDDCERCGGKAGLGERTLKWICDDCLSCKDIMHVHTTREINGASVFRYTITTMYSIAFMIMVCLEIAWRWG